MKQTKPNSTGDSIIAFLLIVGVCYGVFTTIKDGFH